jgi:hypothetical protein
MFLRLDATDAHPVPMNTKDRIQPPLGRHTGSFYSELGTDHVTPTKLRMSSALFNPPPSSILRPFQSSAFFNPAIFSIQRIIQSDEYVLCDRDSQRSWTKATKSIGHVRHRITSPSIPPVKSARKFPHAFATNGLVTWFALALLTLAPALHAAELQLASVFSAPHGVAAREADQNLGNGCRPCPDFRSSSPPKRMATSHDVGPVGVGVAFCRTSVSELAK